MREVTQPIEKGLRGHCAAAPVHSAHERSFWFSLRGYRMCTGWHDGTDRLSILPTETWHDLGWRGCRNDWISTHGEHRGRDADSIWLPNDPYLANTLTTRIQGA